MFVCVCVCLIVCNIETSKIDCLGPIWAVGSQRKDFYSNGQCLILNISATHICVDSNLGRAWMYICVMS